MLRACFSAVAVGYLFCSSASALPTVASINLCTDQLVLNVAAPEQILSLSWLSADAEESMLAAEAAQHELNYGNAEEIIRLQPDVVIAGRYTSLFTKTLLRRLGYPVVEIATATSIADIEANLLSVGEAIGQSGKAAQAAAKMRERAQMLAYSGGDQSLSALVIRPGGFTINRDSLANELLQMAGLNNAGAMLGLDEWGSLSVETLLKANPQVIVVTEYRLESASVANAFLKHPAIAAVKNHAQLIALHVRHWACGTPQSLDSVDRILTALTQSADPVKAFASDPR